MVEDVDFDAEEGGKYQRAMDRRDNVDEGMRGQRGAAVAVVVVVVVVVVVERWKEDSLATRIES